MGSIAWREDSVRVAEANAKRAEAQSMTGAMRLAKPATVALRGQRGHAAGRHPGPSARSSAIIIMAQWCAPWRRQHMGRPASSPAASGANTPKAKYAAITRDRTARAATNGLKRRMDAGSAMLAAIIEGAIEGETREMGTWCAILSGNHLCIPRQANVQGRAVFLSRPGTRDIPNQQGAPPKI